MRKKILFPVLILLAALPLYSFKSGEKDPRVISPDVAALVVVSKPATTNSEIFNSATNPAAQAVLDSKDNAGGYLDSAASELNGRVEPVEAPKQAKITASVKQLSPGEEIMNDTDPDFDISDTAGPEETAMPLEVPLQTEQFASINKSQSIEEKPSIPPYPSHTVYTIQTGSYTNFPYARDQFDSIIKALNQEELDFLRIEKVGKFNAVRLGKFDDLKNAENFLSTVKSRLDEAIILNSFIKDERIIQKFNE